MKLFRRSPSQTRSIVAPRAGAWIETSSCMSLNVGFFVAPRAGAWIETAPLPNKCQTKVWSHPVRVRGLKPGYRRTNGLGLESHPVRVRELKTHWGQDRCNDLHRRTPVRGAWIETGRPAHQSTKQASRPCAGGAWIETVGGIHKTGAVIVAPVRVRGLNITLPKSSIALARSHRAGAWIET